MAPVAPHALRPTCAEPASTGLYQVLGLTVRSELPLLAQPAGPEAVPDCEFRLQLDESPPSPPGPAVGTAGRQGVEFSALHRDARGDWLFNRGVGVFHLSADGTAVTVYPHDGVDSRTLAFVLIGQVPVMLLRRRGVPCLHASAVTTERGSLAFVGTNGQGKSTLAASFLSHGALLLSDDLLPLRLRGDRVEAGPSLPLMKLWPDSAAASFERGAELPELWPGADKRVAQVDETTALAPAAAPLKLLYVLERYEPELAGRDDIVTAPLPLPQALTTLLSHTCWNSLFSPAESARLFPLFGRFLRQTSVRGLRYPNGYHYQEALRARLLSELDAT